MTAENPSSVKLECAAETIRRVLVEGERDGGWDCTQYTRGQRSGLLIALRVITDRSLAELRAELDAAVKKEPLPCYWRTDRHAS